MAEFFLTENGCVFPSGSGREFRLGRGPRVGSAELVLNLQSPATLRVSSGGRQTQAQPNRPSTHAHHNTGESPLEDAEYDRLRDQLAALDPANPFLHEVGAPVEDGPDALSKVQHKIPMGSLDKAMNKAEFDKWVTTNTDTP